MVTRQRLTILIVLAVFSLSAYADQGKNAYNRGVHAEQKRDFDAAYGYFKEAYDSAPNNAKYLAAYTRLRFNAATQHIHTGQMLRNAGALKNALGEFQRAVEIDSSSFIAQQELRRTADMLRRQEQRKAEPVAQPPAPKPSEEAISPPVELQPFSNAPITMYMTANADVAYKTIGKLAGFNVLIDPDYKPQKITVDLTNVTLRDALDMVRLQSKTFWRPVLPNVIFVSADTSAKRKELEQNVMKTFYLHNTETPNELQEAANIVRQMLDLTRVQLVQAQDALILRGTPDQMVLAEKLLADFDKPRSEVVIDIAVMQVSRDRLRTLGNTVPTSFSVSPVPTTISATNSTSGSGTNSGSGGSTNNSGAFTFNSIKNLGSGNNWLVGVPGTTFSLLSTDSNTKLLQNPEIRALSNEKATLRIGDRVPIATGSYQNGITGGGSVSPLIGTQFQYLDVGVNIDITPHVHANGEVTLKMALEISSVTGQQNIGGVTQPIIGQRRIEHETRLTDGEVNLLGGILEDSDTQSLSGYPWLSRIPILRYLFAQDSRERRENEIVFAITPHIVRSQDINDENMRTVDVGTGNTIDLRRKIVAAPAVPASEHSSDPAKPPQQPATPPPSAPVASPFTTSSPRPNSQP
jgi:general secretion pathway protein D